MPNTFLEDLASKCKQTVEMVYIRKSPMRSIYSAPGMISFLMGNSSLDQQRAPDVILVISSYVKLDRHLM